MVANTAGSTIRTLTFLPPPPWTSHLSRTGERCWLESPTLTSSPAVLLQPLARAGCEWEPERLDGISFAMWSSFFPTAGTDCWEVNHFGGQVVLVRTSWRKCFLGVVCVYTGHVWGGLVCLACLPVFFVAPQNFYFLELTGSALRWKKSVLETFTTRN